MDSYSDLNYIKPIGKKKGNPVLKTRWLIILLAALGWFDTGYLLYNHFFFQGQCQVLPFNVTFLGSDCGVVTSSAYGTVGGFPLSAWGAIGYTVIFTLTLMSFFNRNYFWGTFLTASFGVIVSWILTWIQYGVIKSFCPLCLVSTTLMTIISMLSLSALIRLQPDFPSGKQLLITLVTAGWIISSGLLAYKITGEMLSFNPPPQSSGGGSPVNLPAGLINDEIITLDALDHLLQENISAPQWQTLTQDPATWQPTWKELRRRALYLQALHQLAEQTASTPQQVLDLAMEQQTDWNLFLDGYLPVKPLSPGSISNTLVLPGQDLIDKLTQYLSNRIDILENIP